jgi:hypothetical protein
MARGERPAKANLKAKKSPDSNAFVSAKVSPRATAYFPEYEVVLFLLDYPIMWK